MVLRYLLEHEAVHTSHVLVLLHEIYSTLSYLYVSEFCFNVCYIYFVRSHIHSHNCTCQPFFLSKFFAM
jgi:hypothetical protein